MPNRIIKESICTSDSVDALSWFEEVLFYRLIVNCDDYGRFDGRTAVIKNRLFPLKDNLTLKAVENAINKLVIAGIVMPYECDGKPYLYLPTWNEHQSVRAKRSKYPAPDGNMQAHESICMQMKSYESTCMQMQANAPVIQSNPNPNPNPESESKTRMREPTLAEVTDYCREKNLDVDPQTFFDYFNTPNDKGERWVDSKGNKVRNWKQKLLTWASHGGGRRAPAQTNRYSHLEQMYQAALEEENAKE